MLIIRVSIHSCASLSLMSWIGPKIPAPLTRIDGRAQAGRARRDAVERAGIAEVGGRDLGAEVCHRPAFVSRWKTSRRVLESTIPSSRKIISGFIASSDHRS